MPETTQTLEKDLRSMTARTVLLGWSPEAMEGLRQVGRDFIAVVPPDFSAYMEEKGIPYEPWDFGKIDDGATELVRRLRERGAGFAVPLYEQTVEWAGFINGSLRGDPKLFRRSLLFRDKAMMKRMAQMSGLRVGVFEEVGGREEVKRFLHRVNEALLKIEGEDPDPVHLKPLAAAGTVGHRIIRSDDDADGVPEEEFPLLAESHLAGQEFSCEAFVHDGKVWFLNITQYVRLGYSNFIPAGPELEKHRASVQEAVQTLVESFRLDHGVVHPEFFITPDGKLRFGEVAARVPGGHIFELIQRAYGFDAYAAMVLCSDPETTEEELRAFFPKPVEGAHGHAGCVMVYPKQRRIEHLAVPEELLEEPYYERHTLVEPLASKVPEREGFGGHYGTVFFFGDDPGRMEAVLTKYQDQDFYT